MTLLALLAFILFVAFRILRGYRAERASLRGARVSLNTGQERRLFPGLEAVEFPVRGLRVRGWLVPGVNRAGVLLVHGTSSHRASVRDEAHIFSKAGFTVLSFDQPGHGESEGAVDFRGINRVAIVEAARFLQSRTEVDPARIGGLGLSYGGYDLVHAAAKAGLMAIAVAGTPSDLIAHTHTEYPTLLEHTGATWAMRQVGVPLGEPTAAEAAAALAPRPLLVLWGAKDFAVPRPNAELVYLGAHEPKTWVVLQNSAHCDYAKADRAQYEQVLLDFFQGALLRQ